MMRPVIALLLIVTSLFALAVAPGSAQGGPVDLIFINGNIYTVNPRQPKASAIAVKGDRIVYVGTNEGAIRRLGPHTRTIDLKGKTVVPGLTDSHCHLLGLGEREVTLNLEGVNDARRFSSARQGAR